MRFPMRIDPIWRPLLLVGAATRENSFVEVADESVTFHFGLLFRRSVPRSDIVSAATRHWPLWFGVGWRSNLRGVIGLIGSYEGVVEVKLGKRTRAWAVFPCDRIAVSLEDPNGFLAALEGEPAAGAEPSEAGAAQSAPRPRRPRTRKAPSA